MVVLIGFGRECDVLVLLVLLGFVVVVLVHYPSKKYKKYSSIKVR